MTTEAPSRRFEDRLLAELEQLVAPEPAVAPGARERGHRRLPRRRVAMVAAVLAVLTAGAGATVSTLDGSPAQLAQAAVIARAAAALAQPHAILHVWAETFTGGQAICLGEEVPLRCLDTAAATAATGWLRTYSYQEWLGADRDREHTIYDTRDETAVDGSRSRYEVYDPADDTITTTFTQAAVSSPAAHLTAGSIPDPSDLTVSDIRSLYDQARAGGRMVHLLGRTVIDGQAVYELSIGFQPTPPAKCSAACAASISALLLYVDSRTFLPVRAVVSAFNVVDSTTDFRAQLLADTPGNQRLLQMSAHPGAKRVRLTRTQFRAELAARPPGKRLIFAPPPASGAAARRHRSTG